MKTKTTKKTKTKIDPWAIRAQKIAAARAVNAAKGTSVRQQRAAAKLARERAAAKSSRPKTAKAAPVKTTKPATKWTGDRQRRAAAKVAKATQHPITMTGDAAVDALRSLHTMLDTAKGDAS